MEIVEFLRARLDEDERQAAGELHGRFEVVDRDLTLSAFAPARVLREVETKRRIVDEYAEVSRLDSEDWVYEGATGRAHGLGEAVRLLALPHSDHPDYQQEWKP